MSGFLSHIHYLRGIAIIMIVGVHARGYLWEWKNEADFNLVVSLFDNGTILFVFISGFLFQHLTHNKFDYPKYLSQKGKYVILPYLIFSIPIIVLRLYTGVEELPMGESFDQKSLIYKISYFLITGAHIVPFWFIPMISIIYLISPIIHKLDNEKFYRYIAPIAIFIGFFTYRSANNLNPLISFFHFIPFYITGMVTSYYHNKIVNSNNTVLAVLIVIYLGITLGELSGVITLDKKLSMEDIIESRELIFNIYTFKALILCWTLLIIFYRLKNENISILNKMAEYSFGIYFIHFYFISLYRKLFEPLTFSLVEFISYFIIVLVLSYLSIALIKAVTGKYSRYITGS